MFALISSLFSGLVRGPVPRPFDRLNKTGARPAGFQTAAGIDRGAYAAYLNYQVVVGRQKAAANAWWGARALYLIVGGTAAAHTSAIVLDWTVRPGRGHHGRLGVPALPPVHAGYERLIVTSLFVVSTLGPPASTAAAWLRGR